MRVHLTKIATRQLNTVFAYVAAENPAAAHRIVLRVEEIRKLLGENPYIGRRLPHRDLRWFPLTPFPYLVYYTVSGGTVRIVRIWHASRRRAELHEPAQAFSTAAIGTLSKDCGVHILSEEERRGVERGLEDARAQLFASGDEVDALFARYRRDARRR